REDVVECVIDAQIESLDVEIHAVGGVICMTTRIASGGKSARHAVHVGDVVIHATADLCAAPPTGFVGGCLLVDLVLQRFDIGLRCGLFGHFFGSRSRRN